MTSVYYNDIDPYCCKVLQKNIERGYLPQGDVDGRDIREVRAEQLVGYQHVHLFAGIGGFPLGLARAGYPEHLRTITGGFPCQDISNAGKQAGIEGERSGLWKEMYRLIRELRPDYAIMENVGALVNRGLSTVLGDLASCGYDAEWQCLRASDFGAPHQRERIFIVAYLHGIGSDARGTKSSITQWTTDTNELGATELAYPTSRGLTTRTELSRQRRETTSHECGTYELAYPHSDRQWNGTHQQESRRECTGTPDTGIHGTLQPMAHSDIQRCEEQHTAPFSRNQGRDSRCVDTHRLSGTTESILGRDTYGLSYGLDRHRWPAGPGQEQHAWEPARVTKKRVAKRVGRLKALGNAIVPQCAEWVARCIVAYEREKERAA